MVSTVDSSGAGVQDGLSSGVMWVLFGAVHFLYSGTSGTRYGVPPPGRGYCSSRRADV